MFSLFKKIIALSSSSPIMKPQKNMNFSHLLSLLLLFVFHSSFCTAKNIITSTSFIADTSTLSSDNNFFKLGFFSRVNTTNRYVGIWLDQDSNQTVIWVANRDKPVINNSRSGVFTISKDGNLVVLDEKSNILWSSNISSPAINTTALLLDSGNLVLQDSVSRVNLWESFKHPSDTFLPTMKFVINTRTEEKTGLSSWRSPSDPSKGRFFFGIDVGNNIAEAYIWEGSGVRWRSGPWNGLSFIGIPWMDSVYFLNGFNLQIEDQTYSLSLPSSNDLLQFEFYQLSSEGNFEQYHLDDNGKSWIIRWSALKTPCDIYGSCGDYGICDPKSSPICGCLKGFQPKNGLEWDQGNWGNGCVRKTLLECEKVKNGSVEQGKEDRFLKLETVNLPHFAESLSSSVTAEDCRVKCLDNCSCSAYAFENGIGCMLWNGNLIDARKLEFGGAAFYLKLTYSELEDSRKGFKAIIMASVIAGIGTLIIIFVTCILWRRIICQKAKKEGKNKLLLLDERLEILKVMDHRIGMNLNQELPTYDFEKLAIATNNFHLDNKLGQGGFGPVYKGRLVDGQEIAIKRLSKASSQGIEEFINEVKVISKLQHRNLVRLLGYCVEGEEKMLIYEYMPNLSLDALIFDSSKSKQKLIDWRKRFDIIMGIARGLLYLHRDSRLKIIHRDLKASNILLDKDLKPKISDFGMARIFGNNEDQANTLRVVGTYGYMSPEYAMQGRFSEKSDVFSFGVLLLEMISGRRNTSFNHHEDVLSLLELVWKLWSEGNIISLIDQTINDSCHHTQILRCIHIGLLCIQESVKDRPDMLIILSMLNSEITNLYPPKQPGFTNIQFETATNLAQLSQVKCSVNMVTITQVVGR